MRHNNPSAGSAAEWLRYAHSDLEIARVTLSPDMMLESLCFHAQQTAEKALKAVLLAYEIPFPRTQSIRRLLDLLPPDLPVPEIVQDAASLTDYAVLTRYPGDLEPVGEEEYQEAIRSAEAVLSWTEETIQTLRNPPQAPENQSEETIKPLPCERGNSG
jgi:HEPN domain-containing protein